MTNRVVVTGIGVFAANGSTRDAFWDSLMAGRSGVGPVTLFDADEFKCRIAGEVKDFDPHDYIDPILKPKRRMARAAQLAIAASHDAIGDARLTVADLQARDVVPVILGVSTNAMDVLGRPPTPWTAIAAIPHAVTSAIAFGLGFQSRLSTLSNGCASGMDALWQATMEIRQGKTDLILTGSADAALSPYAFKSFEASRTMSLRNETPAKASRPFDRNRDGGVAAEGGAILVLENMEHARARGVPIYAEIVSYGSSADTPASREGSGLSIAMQMAMANAGCGPQEISCVSAHAPSDPHMDRIEVELIKQVLGSHAYRVPVTSVKGNTGNPMAVGGVLQVIAAALSLHYQTVPPTANLDTPDPQCDLDHVPGTPRRLDLRRAMINVHGFGRGNSCMLLDTVHN
ncbi:MAG: beta-ketoacyl-[acyl-carrier-protein] synthase family protein [Lentisphaerae bacterium]|nr:beta-ketoacyl-[acyl-carrier-protein] synthase family protein [Lentisphaerota bacterium]